MAMAASEYGPLDFQQYNLLYTFKTHNPAKNCHCTRKTPDEVKTEVIQSARIRQVVREVAESSGNSVESVQREAHAILHEIAHNMALPAVRTLASVLRSVFMRILTAVYVNKDGIEVLSHTVVEWPTVLLPSHRSYLDFILVSYVMFEHNIALPCIAAGQDFMSMHGISPLLRRSGAFFLRRTFGSDKLYKAVFSEYVKAVLYSGDYPMEFFVEGTRSRNGKSLHPRLGLLSMVMEPYLKGCLPDIKLVPISISYERTLEETLFARELLGVPKPKESTSALFKASSILSEQYGSIIVHIGKPLSVHDICQHYGLSRVPHSLQPREMSVLLPEDWKVAEAVGSIVLDHINNNMKIFPTSLVATALLDHPTGCSYDTLVDQVEWIAVQVRVQGGQVAPGYDKMVPSGLKMLSQVVKVSANNVIAIGSPAVPPVDKIPASKNELFSARIKPDYFSQILMVAHYHLHLAHYRNQLMHLFVVDAMVALCLTSQKMEYCTLSIKFSTLHLCLASEFILPPKSPDELLQEVTDHFLDRGIITTLQSTSGNKLLYLKNSQLKTLHFLQRLLLPFISGIWVVCLQLQSLNGGVESFASTVKATQQLAAKCLKFSLLESYEILSLSIIKNALSSLHQAGLILQASNEFGTGKDRLVKVVQKEKLATVTGLLGAIVLPQWTHKL